ncbi:hypothetical protein LOTGIDRAFT_231307 [Lottia gigantea]|uniref:CHAT domain-containing protein n=1 Tax=Lottia gigantea TaxID=225164 RepID=V4AP74_LOTGI|nr:hypothetical protein LOTGIDRAFT_231307 [Lottia gigantea]ESO98992.1 hypothetical protein LOTGIDRAFT_231307 [Lottia gigantea]
MEKFYNTPIFGGYSLPTLTEGSIVISEAEEINEVKSLHEQGIQATSSQEYNEAVALYNEALEIDSTNPSVLAARAYAYIEIGNYAGALHDAEAALAIDPQNSQVNCVLGLALHYLGQSSDGLLSLLTGLELDLEDASQITDHIVLLVTGICKLESQISDGLREMDNYKKLTEVGVLLYQNKKYDLCIHVLETAQKLQTNQKGITMRLLLTLANAFSACRKIVEAINCYMECYGVSLATHDTLYETKSLVNIATLYLETGDTYQAIINYEKLHHLEAELITELNGEVSMPDYWTKELQCGLHLNLSIAYKTIGNIHSAVNHAKTYMALLEKYGFSGKMHAESYHNTGMLNEILGNYTEALESYKKYLALSKKEGKKKCIGQAYGCLGSVYAALRNWQLAVTYHEQHIKIAKKAQDKKMLINAYEMLGDTYMSKGDYETAVTTFEAMLNTCIRTDYRNKATAICKLGNAYRAQGKHQYSMYFYQQASDLAVDFDFGDIQTMSQYNIACMNQNSTQMADIELARKYFLKLIPYFEKKITEHDEQGSYCPAEYKQQLQQCYDGVINVLAKIGNKEDCLEFAESCRKRCVTQLPNYSSVPGQNVYRTSEKWSCQKLESVVSGQSATVLYYSLLDSNLLLWVLQPAEGLTRFYTRRAPKHITMTEKIENLLQQLFTGMDYKNRLNECENRALPSANSHIDAIRAKNQKLSKGTKSNQSEVTRKTSEDEEASKRSVERQLYDILLSPIEDILSKLQPNSNLIIIPDKHLNHCPFSLLQNWTLVPLANRFTITYLPCLLLLDRVLRNEIEALRLLDELKFERSQSRCGRVSKLLKLRCTGSVYSDTPEMSRENTMINLKSVSNPRLCTSQSSVKLEKGNTSVSLGISRENTFLTLSSRLGPDGTQDVPSLSVGLGHPVSPEKMMSTHTFTTLTSETATGTDIVQSSQAVTQFVQLSSPDKCLVIGAPKFNSSLVLNGKEWKPHSDMNSAKKELKNIAKCLDIDPIIGEDATKDRFLQEIQKATVIHIATFGCLEKGYLVMTPNSRNEDNPLPEESYLITPEDILNIKLQAQLVVLNVGYSPTRQQYIHPSFILPTLFLASGAQCVLINQWQLPDVIMNKFYHHFYLALQDTTRLSQAVASSIEVLKTDDRCNHVCLWCPFILVGKDITINIKTIKQAMLNQYIDRVENTVQDETCQQYLNLPSSITPIASSEENKEKLQRILIKLLSHCPHQLSVLHDLLELLDAALKRLHTEENNKLTSSLTDNIIKSNGGLELLKLLGFHFQAKGYELDKPYIIYPHWNHDSLLIPAYDSIRSLTDLSSSPRCCQVMSYIFPLKQDNISLMVDLLCLTKHASDIQLKVCDLSVRLLWQNKQIRKLLIETGFHQIGYLLNFNQTALNRKLLTGLLQLLLAISCYKSQVLLYRLDVSLLGHTVGLQTYNTSTEIKNLPSLTPLILPRNQLRMSTPWFSRTESFSEMEEKICLARSKSELDEEYDENKQQVKDWHKSSVVAQANEMLEEVGQPVSRESKIKVVHGSGGLKDIIPIEKKHHLLNREIDQRRDYAHFVYNQRLNNVNSRYRNDVMKLYLPYIKSN